MTNMPESDQIVLVTGGTGFVGRYVVRELERQGARVRVVSRRPPGDADAQAEGGVEYISGDLDDLDAIKQACSGCSVIIHLVGIIEEDPGREITFESVHEDGTRNVVAAAHHAGIETFVHMSANGARANGVSRYQTTKWAAEEMVKTAGFKRWSIFRPSLVFGRPAAGQPEFCSQLVRTLIKPFPVWPVFGSGNYPFRPVAVEDLSAGFVSAALSPPNENKTYCVAGPTVFRYVDLLDVLSRAIGRSPRPKVRQPVWLARTVVNAMSPTGLLPISSDQLEMLLEGKTCDPQDFVSTFGINPTEFGVETLSYLNDE
jgi:uncharacterized protein YbjT (DUF2867 family)